MKSVPNHIAIIMDGNRRWARERGLPDLAGHKRVTDEILEPLVEYAAKKGVKYLTFWAWSTENWQRQKREVSSIMKLFKYVIQNRWQRLHEKGVKIQVIGDISKFDSDIKNSLEKVIEQTKNNKTITVIFALNYGGRDELLRAVNKAISYQSSVISSQLVYHPKLSPSSRGRSPKDLPIDFHEGDSSPDKPVQNDGSLTPDTLEKFLDTVGIPDPEIIVRTGGEQRLSGFLLWQSEYSELYFPKWYMPDFTPEKLDEVIEEYNHRQRRFGR